MGSTVTRLVALFAVISLAGIAFVGFRYVGAAQLIGLGPSVVRVELAESGGIFPKAAVAYRGVEIGQVGTMRVTPGGVEAELELDHSAPNVPANAVAVIANRSAVGEQYVDLEPTADTAPYLTDGSIIPTDHTRTPVPVETLLSNLNSLATSVPIPELRTTVDELDKAFNRTGPQLQRLIDSSNPLIKSALANQPQTTQLLRDGRVVLDTQSQLGNQIINSSRDLATFSDQLKRDDPNLRRLVTAAPPAAQQLEGLINDVGPDLSRTVANLLTVARITTPRLPAIEQLLVTYPVIAAAAPSVVPGDGYVHFGVVLNVNDPPDCRSGYMPVSQWRPATELNIENLNTNIRCNESSPVNVRGSQNAPAPSGGVGSSAPATAGGTGGTNSQATTGTSSSDVSPATALANSNSVPIVVPGLNN